MFYRVYFLSGRVDTVQYIQADIVLRISGARWIGGTVDTIHKDISAASRQKGLTTSHLYIQLDPFALKLTISAVERENAQPKDSLE